MIISKSLFDGLIETKRRMDFALLPIENREVRRYKEDWPEEYDRGLSLCLGIHIKWVSRYKYIGDEYLDLV